MPDPLDLITGAYMQQSAQPGSLPLFPSLGGQQAPSPTGGGRQAQTPSPEQGTAQLGPAMMTPPTPTPEVQPLPDIFNRPIQVAAPQAPFQPEPPPPPPPPAPAAPSPNAINQALALIGILGGLQQTGMNPLFNTFGVEGMVSAPPGAYTGCGQPLLPLAGEYTGGHPGNWLGTGYWSGGNLGFGSGKWGGAGAPEYGTNYGWGGTGVGFNPWLYGASGEHPNPGSQPWSTWEQAMQTVLNSLAPSLQALAPVQTLFSSPFATLGSSGAPGWWDPAPNYQLAVNDPLVNAAITALSQYATTPGV